VSRALIWPVSVAIICAAMVLLGLSCSTVAPPSPPYVPTPQDFARVTPLPLRTNAVPMPVPTAQSQDIVTVDHSVMAQTVRSNPAPNGWSMAATWAKIPLGGPTNLVAFFDTKSNAASTNWSRFFQPYPTNGGTLTQPITNGMGFFRAGFTFSGPSLQ